jgi:hypothetical protein
MLKHVSRISCNSLKTMNDEKSGRSEVVMASYAYHQKISIEGATVAPDQVSSFTIARKLTGSVWPFDLQKTVKGNKRLQLVER